MSDTVQPGTKVDAALWEQFREEVKRRRGGTRGHLRNELENAIRGYIHGGDTTPADIDDRLQRIEAAVGAAPTDGGTHTLPESEHTHTRDSPSEKRPAANTSTDKKIAWLARCVRENHGDGFSEVTRDDLREVVKDEYGFRRDTAKRYVDNLINHFELMTHPATDKVLVTEQRHEQIMENMEDGLHKEAQDEFPDEYEVDK